MSNYHYKLGIGTLLFFLSLNHPVFAVTHPNGSPNPLPSQNKQNKQKTPSILNTNTPKTSFSPQQQQQSAGQYAQQLQQNLHALQQNEANAVDQSKAQTANPQNLQGTLPTTNQNALPPSTNQVPTNPWLKPNPWANTQINPWAPPSQQNQANPLSAPQTGQDQTTQTGVSGPPPTGTPPTPGVQQPQPPGPVTSPNIYLPGGGTQNPNTTATSAP